METGDEERGVHSHPQGRGPGTALPAEKRGAQAGRRGGAAAQASDGAEAAAGRTWTPHWRAG